VCDLIIEVGPLIRPQAVPLYFWLAVRNAKGRALSSSCKTGFPFPRKVHGKDGRREKYMYLSGVYKTKFLKNSGNFPTPTTLMSGKVFTIFIYNLQIFYGVQTHYTGLTFFNSFFFFQFSVVKPKSRLSPRPITSVPDNPMNQSKLLIKTSS